LRFELHDPKELAKPQSQIPKQQVQGTLFVVLIWKYESPVQQKFHNSIWKYVVPYALTAEGLRPVLLSRIFYYRQKYLVDIESWLSLFWEYINRKLFAVW
jgi:hypothetical protein